MCPDNNDCVSDPFAFAINNLYNDPTQFGEIIGIAKDGHVIVGPYNQDGELWGCGDHDVCNGAFVGDNYVYVSTTTFPYILGCFGPGPV